MHADSKRFPCSHPFLTLRDRCIDCQSGVDVVYRCYLDALGSASALHSLSALKAPAGQALPRSLLLQPPSRSLRLRLMVCSVCCYKAEDNAALVSHIKNAHTFCRPYKCSQCNYAALEVSRVRPIWFIL